MASGARLSRTLKGRKRIQCELEEPGLGHRVGVHRGDVQGESESKAQKPGGDLSANTLGPHAASKTSTIRSRNGKPDKLEGLKHRHSLSQNRVPDCQAQNSGSAETLVTMEVKQMRPWANRERARQLKQTWGISPPLWLAGL